MWPGLVGKGGPDAEPPIDLDTMLDLTAAAEVDGVEVRRRRPVPVRSARQHRLDRRRPQAAGRQDRARRTSWSARSSRRSGRRPAAARRWASDEERKQFLDAGAQGLPHRPEAARDSASAATASSASTRPPARRDWAKDPAGNTKKIAETFREAGRHRRRSRRAARRRRRDLLGRHAQRGSDMVELLEHGRPPEDASASRPTWPTRCSTRWATTRPRIASCPQDFDWTDRRRSTTRCKKLTDALRPWTIDFHVAQNDGDRHGSGSHDKTGRHCLPNDPNGKLDIVKHAGYWLRDEQGQARPRRSSTSAGTAACSPTR